MVHCQECGASNASDARFCDQCGAPIARLGEPGGPLEASGPVAADSTLPGHAEPSVRSESRASEASEGRASLERRRDATHDELDASSIRLSAIGVRSRGAAWGVVAGAALALMALGALGMWLALRSDDPQAPVAEGGEPEPRVDPPDAVEIGDPLPEGAEAPDLEVVTGTPRPRAAENRRSPRGAAGPTGARPAAGSSSGSTGASSGVASDGAPSRAAGSAGASGGAAGPVAGGSGASRATSSDNAVEGGGGSTPPSGGAGSGGAIPDWDSLDSERGREMNEYSARVRSVIRQYYAPRAQSCFEHASRNVESVRGTVVVAFRVLADGQLDDAQVRRNTTGIESLGTCLARQVGSWRLPPPPEAPLPMEMPFSR